MKFDLLPFSLNLSSIALLLSFFMPLNADAETYRIKKLNTPTINIDGKPLKIGDSFSDGATIEWSTPRQAMRVLSSKNDVITINASAAAKAGKSRTLVAGLVKMSNRAICTSTSDHKQAFEGVDGKGHVLLDTITIASQWIQDGTNYFQATITTDQGKKVLQLPYNSNGEVIITRHMFDKTITHPSMEMDVDISIEYINGRKNESRLITPSAVIHILPEYLEE